MNNSAGRNSPLPGAFVSRLRMSDGPRRYTVDDAKCKAKSRVCGTMDADPSKV